MRYYFLIIYYVGFTGYAAAQGCSDAGFCSLGAIKNLDPHKTGKNTVAIGSSFGIGERQTLTINPYLQYSSQVESRLQLAVKITSTYADGFLGKVFDAGDIYGFATLSFRKRKYTQGRVVAGFKIPLTSANDKNAAGKPLPLDYQSSIGTYDLVAGINYLIRERFEIDAGLQLPLIQKNRNSFFPDEYTDTRVYDFAPTNQFLRKSDVLLRIGYYFPISPTLVIKPNVLAIYHLGEDSYVNRFNVRTTLPGSSGLTLNAGIVITKQLTSATQLELIAAAPFVVRELRPDGLTRAAAFNIQYSISF